MKRRPNLKTGEKFKDADGYIRVKMPEHPGCDKRGYVREHRLVMEAHLGRYISGKEVIHHRNEVRDDNRVENLQLCDDTAQHIRIHKPPRQCSVPGCGRPHFGKGKCSIHYNRAAAKKRRTAASCEACGKPCPVSYYVCEDKRTLCRKCRYPKRSCEVCGKPAKLKTFCAEHMPDYHKTVPCSKCGKEIRKGGRNCWPPVCWTCKFPKRVCRICGKPHEARGLCDNHLHQFHRGTLKE